MEKEGGRGGQEVGTTEGVGPKETKAHRGLGETKTETEAAGEKPLRGMATGQ